MKKTVSFITNYFEDYHLLGIVSPLKDYTLTYFINKYLDLHLVKYSDLDISGNAGFYSWYYYKQGNKYLSFFLIGNNHPKQKLIPALNNFDYFFLIKDSIEEEQIKVMTNNLRKIHNVVGVFEQEMSSIKGMDVLIESNELHELEQIISSANKSKNKK